MNKTPTLTPKQKKVYQFITQFIEKKGYAPSQQEIARHFKFSSLGTVQNYLVRLERQGVLQKDWNAKRGMQVTPLEAFQSPTPSSGSAFRSKLTPPTHPYLEALPLPLVGKVAAGSPIEAIQNTETLEVPASMLGKGEHFVLQVQGQSMIEDGILEGDFVIIKKQQTAQNGQTVVALLGNEATIKRFYRKDRQIELHPANAAYEPIVLKDDEQVKDFKIEGLLVGVIRKLD